MFLNIGTDIGIDLGTTTVLVYIKGKGVILNEPSIVAMERGRNTVIAIGEEARQMIDKSPGNIVAFRPLKDGVISDYGVTEKMFKYFISKATGSRRMSAPRVVVCIPCISSEVEKRAIIDAAKNAGAKKVYLIEEPLAAAIGADIDMTKASGNMIINIGGAVADIAVISLGGIVVRASIGVAGDKFDEAIIKYIRKKYKLMIGEKTAENLKINIGSAYDKDIKDIKEVRGRDFITGLPKNIIVSSDEMREALKEPVDAIIDAVRSVLRRTPPELSADISDKGIVMTGGGSLLRGLNLALQESTNVTVRVVDDPISCVAIGTGNVFAYPNKMEVILSGKDISLIY